MIPSDMRTTFRLALWLACAALCAAAQQGASKPIVLKLPKQKLATFKAEVMSATNYSITVRSRENNSLVRTFTYTEQTRAQMQKTIDAGGYHYGDKVEIQFDPGSDVAVKIKGKPSRPK